MNHAPSCTMRACKVLGMPKTQQRAFFIEIQFLADKVLGFANLGLNTRVFMFKPIYGEHMYYLYAFHNNVMFFCAPGKALIILL